MTELAAGDTPVRAALDAEVGLELVLTADGFRAVTAFGDPAARLRTADGEPRATDGRGVGAAVGLAEVAAHPPARTLQSTTVRIMGGSRTHTEHSRASGCISFTARSPRRSKVRR